MSTCKQLLALLADGAYDARLKRVYRCEGEPLLAARARVAEAIRRFQVCFSVPDDTGISVFSGPGRTELGGNHTDHQHGRVLCASVNLDMLACAAPNGTNCIRIHSEGYPLLKVDLELLDSRPEEYGTSAALVRGVVAEMRARSHIVRGFDAYVSSAVPAGSGLSSSAAYEVLIGTIANHLFCGAAFSAVQLAQIGQAAENKFFGKPCGLMDQMASAVGGTVFIDFADPQNPVVRRIDYDFAASGHTLCIIDSGADHADLTAAYAAITEEMGSVAAAFGKQVLRDVDEVDFTARIPLLRQALGDRAILRAMHFFSEDRRAAGEADALANQDFPRFLALVRSSGNSSSLYLQNTFVSTNPRQQAVPLALAVAEELLNGVGAARVHGGGFAGTIQAFVPNSLLPAFKARMEALLGPDMCHVLSIRPVGGCILLGDTEDWL